MTVNRLFTMTLAIAALGTSLIVPAYADTKVPAKTSSTKHVAAVTKWPQVCPVSGESIASAKDAVGSSIYKGKTYYFCCPMCKPEFDKNPAKYAAAAAKGKYLAPM